MPSLIKTFGTGYYYFINMKQYTSTLTRSCYINLKSSPFPSCPIPNPLSVLHLWSNGQNETISPFVPWPRAFFMIPWQSHGKPWHVSLFDAFLGRSSSLHIISLFHIQDSFWLHVQHGTHALSCHVGSGILCPNSLKSIFFMNISYISISCQQESNF